MRAVPCAAAGLLLASPALAQPLADAGTAGGDVERAAVWIVLGAALPLLAVIATAFTKLAVVLGILRNALGAPGALPASVTTGLAAILAVLVMTPTARRAAEAVGPEWPSGPAGWVAAGERAWPPVRDFLDEHTRPEDRSAFAELTARLDPGAPSASEAPATRLAAFVVSELTAAFNLGVLLLLPFLVVDLLTANTLAALGYALLPPAAVALPFKLLLFLAADGWGLLIRGALQSYAS